MTRKKIREENNYFSDGTLSRRLERTEAKSGAGFVEARARLFPGSDVEWIEVAGAYALFDGVGSPVTQTFGLGLFEEVGEAELGKIENFFRARNSPVFHEVSPMGDPALTSLFNQRGYHPLEYSSVLIRRLDSIPVSNTSDGKVKVRLIEDHEKQLWADVSAEGWREFTELKDFIREISNISSYRTDASLFLAELDGQAIATGALCIHDGVALLAGASTIPEYRQRGAQSALLDARLRYASEHDCDLAMICTQPGSASQRNAERNGFRIAYTRTKWQLTFPAKNL